MYSRLTVSTGTYIQILSGGFTIYSALLAPVMWGCDKGLVALLESSYMSVALACSLSGYTSNRTTDNPNCNHKIKKIIIIVIHANEQWYKSCRSFDSRKQTGFHTSIILK